MNNPQPVKFLIVDDREENLTALEALLRRDGLEIHKARTGNEALEILLQHDVALALLDVQMPDMDGFALAEMMRGSERSRHVPIIFVTAAVQEQHRDVSWLRRRRGRLPLQAPRAAHLATQGLDLLRPLQAAAAGLAETLSVNETFVAVIGHDLKNPIHSIALAAELILRHPPDEQTKRLAERIRSSSRRMVGMIDDLFDLARVRLGEGIPLERARVDMDAIARSVVAECLAASPGAVIELRHDGSTSGEWDSGRIEQILSNLVGNAVRHGSPGAAISVVVQGEDDHVQLSVHNAGAISAAVQNTMFDPFRGAARGRARKDGLGLGLYIVQQLVVAHGGTVEVESERRRWDHVPRPASEELRRRLSVVSPQSTARTSTRDRRRVRSRYAWGGPAARARRERGRASGPGSRRAAGRRPPPGGPRR